MAYTFNTELRSIALNYIDILQAKVTNSTVNKEIEEHPYYPSLLALSDTFNRYKISNSAFVVSKKEFLEISQNTPFVAFMKINNTGDDFVLVTDITKDEVKYYYKSNKIIKVATSEFLENFKEIVWKAELTQDSGQLDFDKKVKEERIIENRKLWLSIGWILIFVAVFCSNILDKNIVSLGMLTVIKFVGLFVSSLIITYEVNKNNAFIKNICNFNAKTNCEAVLSSKASKFFGISWGEIGLLYFMSTTLGLLLPIISFEIKSAWIAIGNVIALPYVFFSLIYQWKVVKQWCPLCLLIQATLLSELIWAILFIWQHNLPFILDISTIVSLLFSITLSIIFWFSFKPILIKNNDYDLYVKAYRRLQYNPDIFDSLLKQQAKAIGEWHNLGIDVGNPNAKRTVIKVCNPYCGPCDQAHPILEKLIEENNDVKLKIIYITKNDELDNGRFIIRHLLAIAEENDNKKLQQALDDWYGNPVIKKNYELFKKKYPKDEALIDKQSSKIDAMRRWIDDASITHTPTIFIDGYRLPENYEIEELKYVL